MTSRSTREISQTVSMWYLASHYKDGRSSKRNLKLDSEAENLILDPMWPIQCEIFPCEKEFQGHVAVNFAKHSSLMG